MKDKSRHKQIGKKKNNRIGTINQRTNSFKRPIKETDLWQGYIEKKNQKLVNSLRNTKRMRNKDMKED